MGYLPPHRPRKTFIACSSVTFKAWSNACGEANTFSVTEIAMLLFPRSFRNRKYRPPAGKNPPADGAFMPQPEFTALLRAPQVAGSRSLSR